MSKQPLVYAILNESLHPETGRPTIKIGFTDELEERLRDLQTGNASRLRYINRIYIPKHLMNYEEDLAHNHFSDYRLEGEHFDISLEQISDYFKTRQNEYKQKEGLDGEIIINKKYRNSVRTGYPCFFYPEQQAQDIFGPKSKEVLSCIARGFPMKDTTRYRKMEWPGVSKANKSYAGLTKNGVTRVYISQKKHEENIEQNQYEKNKKSNANLDEFF
jgi:hypothetical protein